MMNKDTLLLRQVNPAFVQGDNISEQVFSITSQVFKPTQKDKGLLSTYNGDKFSAEESFNHFMSSEGNSSIGVVGVTNEECSTLSLPIINDNIPFEGHCSIDYRGLSQGQTSKKAKKLKVYAVNKGWLYVNEK